MNQQQHRLMQVLQKISIFEGLELEHIQRLLRVGTSRKYELGERVYTIGEDSNEMLVLLQGRLVVTSSAGDVLGEIGPGMPTGEMGVFTNQPRSANISAAERSVALIVDRRALMSALASNQTVHVSILKNFVKILSDRLSSANLQSDKLQNRILELEEEENADGVRADDSVASELDEYPDDDYGDDDE